MMFVRVCTAGAGLYIDIPLYIYLHIYSDIQRLSGLRSRARQIGDGGVWSRLQRRAAGLLRKPQVSGRAYFAQLGFNQPLGGVTDSAGRPRRSRVEC